MTGMNDILKWKLIYGFIVMAYTLECELQSTVLYLKCNIMINENKVTKNNKFLMVCHSSAGCSTYNIVYILKIQIGKRN